MECFLGLKLKEHFPSVALKPSQCPVDESEDDEADLEPSFSTLRDKVMLLEDKYCTR